MIVLAGDIGGTKTLLQIYDAAQGQEINTQNFESSCYATFDVLLATFLKSLDCGVRESIKSVCFAVAGPVYDGVKGQVAQVTNLPWNLNSIDLSQFFNGASVCLVNDFVAVCHGVALLEEKDIFVLQPGKSLPGAHQAVIGAGTGLGMGQIVSYENRDCILPAEGGHADFAPGSLIQSELLNYLLHKGGRVSIESVCSGRGLLNIYCFIRDLEPEKESAELREKIKNSDPAAAITYFAKEYQDILAEKSLKLFVEVYGAVAGNFALTILPLGGLYIAGGIAPKIIDWMRQDIFMQAFNNKNKMTGLLENIPVRLVLNTHVGLLGAVFVGSRY
ncbi:MAG: glucokinase [Gammaproteobacteria bacterium]|nr:glucokinase [Gammaproteobacteria bacterium]